jgi:tungstate transport system ATP-binding protein
MEILKLGPMHFSYNGTTILDLPRLELQAGRIYALTGPNGAGKTTLLKLLGGLIVPSQTEFSPKADVWSASVREIGMVLQHPYLFNFSVFENIALPLRLQKRPKAEIRQRVDSLTERLNLSHLCLRSRHELSGGEIQRIALARALATDPHILLLDEPLANVDLSSQQIIEALLVELNREKQVTIIFSSHDHALAKRLAHRIIHLCQGRLVENLD